MNPSVKKKAQAEKENSPPISDPSLPISVNLEVLTKVTIRFFSEYVLTAVGSGISTGYLEAFPDMYYAIETGQPGCWSLRKVLPGVGM